jgi:probable addiction module antidote protein
MPAETKPWDPAVHLDTEEAVIAYLDAAFEDGDPALMAAALGDVARSRGMSRIAREAGLTREGLYRALSHDGDPELATVMKVFSALGVRLRATAA